MIKTPTHIIFRGSNSIPVALFSDDTTIKINSKFKRALFWLLTELTFDSVMRSTNYPIINTGRNTITLDGDFE
ncbi:hypothetical protein [Pseudoalteromonas phage C7]|uniref:hypothetical protein n=1 Tax=Pseudoalteromonas phage C7 TaxID=2510494 RepID=UPI0010187BA9|nr:hypothetical protein PP587_gp21 [Pseudoalteromonas phage C7]QAY17975.1 hypothetical protein [Pseudoalteromonas phage C7]